VTAPWPFVAAMAIVGLVIGSFLNVVIYRVPRGESLISPGSHCPACDTPIKGRHNVPVLSWLVLRGRCAYCKAHISVRYPLVEASSAILFAGITARIGISPQLPAYLYLAAIAVVLTMIDFDVRLLPDSIVLPSYVVTTLLLTPAVASVGRWWNGERALIGMVSLLAVFFALALSYPNAINFGDVKLAGLLGLYLGWLSWSALAIGVAGSLLIAACTGTASLAVNRGTRAVAVPLAPCLLGAAVLALFVAAPVAGSYGTLLRV
jgi:leader peptidase (prepilin peptidase)/N-methyltransferase